MVALVILNAVVFVSISFLHFYWAAGGKYGSIAVLPSGADGKLLFRPGLFSTLVVAFGLLFFAVVTMGNLSIFDRWIDLKYIHTGTWIIGAIFIARAIGDFKFIGFFKKITDTLFAKNGTRLYSPLSLLMGVISVLVAILS